MTFVRPSPQTIARWLGQHQIPGIAKDLITAFQKVARDRMAGDLLVYFESDSTE